MGLEGFEIARPPKENNVRLYLMEEEMKKLFAILAAAMLVVGVAGNAMAVFELGNTQLVAYVEADNSSLPVGTAGNEVHFDLGAGLFDLTTDLDTGITLADLGATSWDDVYVGIVGGGYDSGFMYVDPIFSSDTASFTASSSLVSQYQSALFNMSSVTGPKDAIQPKVTGTYYANMLLGGTGAGTYAGLVTASSDFGAETQMNGGLAEAAMYSFDADGTGAITELLAFNFDTTGSTLVLTQVPVPAAVWLLGSGLLGLIGIRRRNA